MKLRIISNKDIAFCIWLRNLVNNKRWPWIGRDFVGTVPRGLLEGAAEFSYPPIQSFSFEKHPLEDFDNYSSKFKGFIKKVEKIHSKEWRKYEKDLRSGKKFLSKTIKKYGDFIIKTISKTSKNKWRFSEIWFVPVIYAGGTVVGNKVFVGCNNRTEDKFLNLIIHESFHVNEPPREEMEKFTKNFRLPRDSREIATVLMTNKVINRLNKKFKINLPPQNFHSYFREAIVKFQPGLYKLAENSKSFYSLIKSVDDFLSKKGYKGYY